VLILERDDNMFRVTAITGNLCFVFITEFSVLFFYLFGWLQLIFYYHCLEIPSSFKFDICVSVHHT